MISGSYSHVPASALFGTSRRPQRCLVTSLRSPFRNLSIYTACAGQWFRQSRTLYEVQLS